MLSKNSKVFFEIDIDQEQIRKTRSLQHEISECYWFFKTAYCCRGKRREGTGFDLMRHHHQDPFAYSEATLERTAIIKVKIEVRLERHVATDSCV